MPVVVFVLIGLPWLNPFSPGPLAQEMPLLFAWFCNAGVLLAFALDRQRGQHTAMVRALALGWGTAAALNAVIGLLQYFGATAWAGVWLNHTDVGAAFGNLRQRNQFATLLGIGLAAALWWAAAVDSQPTIPKSAWLLEADAPWQSHFSRWPGYLRRHATLLASALAALVGAGNAASGSRTGLMQLLLTLALVLWWWRGSSTSAAQKKRVQLTLLAALVAYALAQVALPLLAGINHWHSGALARLRDGDSVCASRLTLWANVLHLIAQKPWLGWGWGELDYAHFITLYPGARFCDILDNAHNLPLQLAVELGVPLALLLCGGALWLVWRARPWAERQRTRQLAWIMLAVIGLHSLLEYPLWYGPFQAATLLSVWLLAWVPRQGGATNAPKFKFVWQDPTSRLPAHYFYGLPAIFIIVICGFAAGQYRIASQIYLDPGQRAPAYRVRTLEQIKDVWLYQAPVRFAELTTTGLDANNAAYINKLAKEMLHFSPETRVVQLLLDSARLLGRKDEVAFYAERFKAAFPEDYGRWVQTDAPAPVQPQN